MAGVAESQLKPDGSAFYAKEHSDSAFMCGKAMEFIRSRQSVRGRPWSLHLSLWRPHPPWVCAAPWHARHDPAALTPFVRASSAEAEASLHPWLNWDGSYANLTAARDRHGDAVRPPSWLLRSLPSSCSTWTVL
jgi:hypothetical protein